MQVLFDLWELALPRISCKSKLAEAIRYARSHRAILGRITANSVSDRSLE